VPPTAGLLIIALANLIVIAPLILTSRWGGWKLAILPRGIPHAFRNSTVTPSRALTVFIPGGFDDFVAELQELSPEDAANEKKRDTIRRKYGIEFIRPGSTEPGVAPELGDK
jgi:hypothetical protein